MENRQTRWNKEGKCSNSQPISNLPNAAPALLPKRSVTELSAWPTKCYCVGFQRKPDALLLARP